MSKAPRSNKLVNAEVLRLLQSMSEKELEQLRRGLGDKVKKMLNYFLIYKPDFDNEKITYRSAYKAVYGVYTDKPNKLINDQCNKLKKKAITFILHNVLEKDEMSRNALLAKHFASRGLDKEFEKIKLPQSIDEECLHFTYVMAREKFILQTTSPPRSLTYKSIAQKEVINQLQKSYLFTYIVYWVNAINYYKIRNKVEECPIEPPDGKFLEQVLAICTPEEKQIIGLWIEARSFILGEKERSEFESQVIQCQHLIPPFDLANLIILLLNDFVKNEKNYFKRCVCMFDYFILLQEKEILNSISLVPMLLLQIVTVSLELNRFSWINQKTLNHAKTHKDGGYELFMAAKALHEQGDKIAAKKFLNEAKSKRGNAQVLIEQLLKSIIHRLELSIDYVDDSTDFTLSRKRFDKHLKRFESYDRPEYIKNYQSYIKLINKLHNLSGLKKNIFKADEESESFFGLEEIRYDEHWLQTQFEQFIKPLYSLKKEREQLKTQWKNQALSKIDRINFNQKTNKVKDNFEESYALANQHFLGFYEEIVTFNTAENNSSVLEERICIEPSLIDRLWLLDEVFKFKNGKD